MNNTITNKIYYEPQTGWNREDYYYLHRVLHRTLYYYEKYAEEIKSMDVTKMSETTRVLIYCIIKYYHYDFLFDSNSSFERLKDTKPLKKLLILDDNPLPEDNIYKEMNVMY